MVITTRGVIFRVVKYRETSIITTIYTEDYGLLTYIANNVRSPKAKFSIGYFELLNLVEITAYHNPSKDINRLSEIKISYPLHSLRQDIYKSAIIIFLAEVLNKCIVEHDKNKELFTFISSSIMVLETIERNNSFHLQFMFKLSTFLGFGITEPTFFINEAIDSKYYLDQAIAKRLQKLIENDLSDIFSINSADRRTILNDLIHFYQLQIGMGKLKSLEVLNTVLS